MSFLEALEACLDARDQWLRCRGLRKYEPEAKQILDRARRRLAASRRPSR